MTREKMILGTILIACIVGAGVMAVDEFVNGWWPVGVLFLGIAYLIGHGVFWRREE